MKKKTLFSVLLVCLLTMMSAVQVFADEPYLFDTTGDGNLNAAVWDKDGDGNYETVELNYGNMLGEGEDPDPDPDPPVPPVPDPPVPPVPDPIPVPIPEPIKLPVPNATVNLINMTLNDVSGNLVSFSVNGGHWSYPQIGGGSLDGYGIKANDYIKVKYIATPNSEEIDSDEQTISIEQARAPIGIFTTDAPNAGANGSINGLDTTMEYCVSGTGNFISISSSSVSVQPGNYDVRVKMSAAKFASSNVTVTVGQGQKQKQPTPNANFNAMNMTLGSVGNGVMYSFDGSNWTRNGSNSNVTVSDSQAASALSHMIQLKTPGDGNTVDSDIQAIKITKANTPNGISSQGASGGNNGAILNIPSNCQYRPCGGNWQNVNGNSVTGLAAGNYDVRVGGMYTCLPSDSVTINISSTGVVTPPGKTGTPSADFDAKTGLLTDLLGTRFSVDGGKTWSAICTANSIVLSASQLSTKNGIEVYRPGDGLTIKDSGVQIIKLAKATKPTKITTTPAKGKATGSINGLNGTLEISPDGGKTWAAVPAGMRVHPATAGTYLVRTEGYHTTLPSDPVKVTVKKTK
ncbi:MAG: hypothetical protein Q4G60_09595 [bacterium]|nr:hypothetical protein [bacterium]